MRPRSGPHPAITACRDVFDWNAFARIAARAAADRLVDLDIGGKPVPHPARDEQQHLWLGKTAAAETTQAEHLGLLVFRLVDDGIPAPRSSRASRSTPAAKCAKETIGHRS